MYNKILNIGVDDAQDMYQKKETNFLNLFSLIIVFSVVLYLIKLFLTGEIQIVRSEIGLFSFSLLVLYFNARKLHLAALYTFILGLNFTMIFVNLSFNISTGHYLYYFPILICTALLHNPIKPVMRTVTMFSVVGLCIVITFILTGRVHFEAETTMEQNHHLLIYNVYNASILTIILMAFIIRMINQQHVDFSSLVDQISKDRVTIQNSLQEKEVLLAEVQHRVKNNLSVIIGLFNLQLDKAENETFKNLLNEAKNRVMSIAMVHQKIYKKEDLSKINLSNYISDLVQEIVKSHSLQESIHVYEDLNNIDAGVTMAVPIGLIVNEVITNSLKHAFKDGSKSGVLKVSLSFLFDKLVLKIQDNGGGFPKNYDAYNKNIGITIINSLSDQLDGVVTYRNEDGAVVELSIPFV